MSTSGALATEAEFPSGEVNVIKEDKHLNGIDFVEVTDRSNGLAAQIHIGQWFAQEEVSTIRELSLPLR